MELFLAAEYDTNVDMRAVSTNKYCNDNTSHRYSPPYSASDDAILIRKYYFIIKKRQP